MVPLDFGVQVKVIIQHRWVLTILSFDHALHLLFANDEGFVPLVGTTRR